MANNLDETHPSNHEEDPLADTKPNRREQEGPGLTQPSQVEAPDPSLTQPSRIDPDTKPGNGEKKPRSSRGLWLGMVASFSVALILITIIAGRLGYNYGQQTIKLQETITSRVYLDQQYQLGLDYMEAGNYTLAMQFFEYVYEQDPTFQEARDRWVEVQVIVNSTATPTSRPVATVTPTQDPRPKEQLFDQIVSLIMAQNWSQALDTISSLRQTDPTFRGPEVDGMIYVALRNRGVDKVLNQGELEGGLYDFTLAEQFGPLDRDAEIYRTWARLYLQGNGFWIAYPGIAADYYGQVAAAAPGLHDESGMSAFYRYWASLVQYGDQLVADGDWCGAMTAYNTAMNARPDGAVMPTAQVAENRCMRETTSPTPHPSGTPTGTGTVVYFTPTPTTTLPAGVTATQTRTPTPTNTGGAPANSPTPTNPLPSSTSTPVPSQTATPMPSNTNTP